MPPHSTRNRDIFLDSTKDSYQGDYTEILRLFDTPLTPLSRGAAKALVNLSFTTCETEYQAYLLLTHEGGKNYIQTVHRPSVLHQLMGSPIANERFAFLGDVRGTQPPLLICWPDKAFDQTNNINVISATAIDTELARMPPVEDLGPFQNNDQGVETVATRKVMYLPFKFVSISLGRALTPRQAWDEIGGAVRAEPPEKQATYEPLLNWLKAALIRFDATAVPANHMPAPRPPTIFTPDYMDHAANILKRDLPAPSPSATAPTGLAPLVSAVNQLTSEVVQTRVEAAQRRSDLSTKTIESHYGRATDILLRLCQVSSESQLPPVYSVIANSTKRNLRVNLEQHAQQVARSIGLEHYTPIITPDLAAKLSTASFKHHEVNKLEDGIQPFLTPAWSSQQREELTTMISVYDTVQEGASVHLHDLLAMRTIARVAPPATMLQVLHNGQAFRILIEMMLGPLHEHTLTFALFMHHLAQALPQLEPLSLSRAAFPMQIIRYIQLRFSTWINLQVDTHDRVPTPHYAQMLDSIRYQERGWEPFIPPQYYTPAAGQRPVPTVSNPPAALPSNAPASVPTPPAARPSTTPATGQRQRVNNTSYNAAYTVFKEKNISLQQARSHAGNAHPIPPSSKGGETCLSYHVLGYCWSNCSRLADHTPQSAADQAATVAWCTAHFV